MFRILGKLNTFSGHAGEPSVACKRRNRTRPGIEPLEERALLSSIAVRYDLSPEGINNAGQIAGGGSQYRGESNGALTPLGGIGLGINDSGDVAGYAGSNVFLYKGGKNTYLGTLPGSIYSEAIAVNNSDQLVGFATEQNGYHAFLYSGGTWTDLYNAGGSKDSLYFAVGINNSGQIVGLGDFPDGRHDFLYSNGTLSELKGFVWASNNGFTADNRGLAINDQGQIVGEGINNNLQEHAFLYSAGTYTDLGTLPGKSTSNANAINNLGQIVGTAYNNLPDFDGRAFLYSNGQMVDLNSMLPANSGWVLQSATGINDHGQIIGFGIYNGAPNQTFLFNLGQYISIYPKSLNWNVANGGVDFTYSAPDPLPVSLPIDLYWSPDATFDASKDHLAFATLVEEGESPSPIHIDPSLIAAPPADAKYLLAVIDPTNTVLPKGTANSLSLLYDPEITVTSKYNGDSRSGEFGRFLSIPGVVTDETFIAQLSDSLAALRPSAVSIWVGDQKLLKDYLRTIPSWASYS